MTIWQVKMTLDTSILGFSLTDILKERKTEGSRRKKLLAGKRQERTAPGKGKKGHVKTEEEIEEEEESKDEKKEEDDDDKGPLPMASYLRSGEGRASSKLESGKQYTVVKPGAKTTPDPKKEKKQYKKIKIKYKEKRINIQ